MKRERETSLNGSQTVQKSHDIGEQLADLSIYVGLSATSGKPLATTNTDIGVYNHYDAEEVVAMLNRHGGRNWRLPTQDELDVNLFENRNTGQLSGTFNLTTNCGAASCYWAGDRSDKFASCKKFSDDGGARNEYAAARLSVRPVRDI